MVSHFISHYLPIVFHLIYHCLSPHLISNCFPLRFLLSSTSLSSTVSYCHPPHLSLFSISSSLSLNISHLISHCLLLSSTSTPTVFHLIFHTLVMSSSLSSTVLHLIPTVSRQHFSRYLPLSSTSSSTIFHHLIYSASLIVFHLISHFLSPHSPTVFHLISCFLLGHLLLLPTVFILHCFLVSSMYLISHFFYLISHCFPTHLSWPAILYPTVSCCHLISHWLSISFILSSTFFYCFPPHLSRGRKKFREVQ